MSYIKTRGFVERAKSAQTLKFKPLAALAHLAPPKAESAAPVEPLPPVMENMPELLPLVAPTTSAVPVSTVPAFDPVQDLAEKTTALYLSGNVAFHGRPMTASDAGVRFIILCWAINKMRQAPATLDELAGGRGEDDPHGRWIAKLFRRVRERGELTSTGFPLFWSFAPGFTPPSTPLDVLRFCLASAHETAPLAAPGPEVTREEAIASVSGLNEILVRAPEPEAAAVGALPVQALFGDLAEINRTLTALVENIILMHGKIAAQDAKLDEVLVLLRPYK